MSYEGYVEYLCETGHFITADCYDETIQRCPRCRAPIEWEHSVDQTNGEEYLPDGSPDPATHPAPKRLRSEIDHWHKDHHGNRYAIKEYLWTTPEHNSVWRKPGSIPFIDDEEKLRHREEEEREAWESFKELARQIESRPSRISAFFRKLFRRQP